jgi:hypothetical protein
MHAVMLGIVSFRLPTLNSVSLTDLSNLTGKIFSNMLNELLDVSVSFYKLYWLILLYLQNSHGLQTVLTNGPIAPKRLLILHFHCTSLYQYLIYFYYYNIDIPQTSLL